MNAKQRAIDLAEEFGEVSVDDLEGVILAAEREATERVKERIAKMADEMAAHCDQNGTDHFCELFGCHSFVEFAASIRGEKKE